VVDAFFRLAMIGAAIVGLVVVGHWLDDARHPLPELV
jgi:hypothetical protein